MFIQLNIDIKTYVLKKNFKRDTWKFCIILKFGDVLSTVLYLNCYITSAETSVHSIL